MIYYLLIADGVIDLISRFIWCLQFVRADGSVLRSRVRRLLPRMRKKKIRTILNPRSQSMQQNQRQSTDDAAGDELPEGDMDEMTKEILNFFEEDK